MKILYLCPDFGIPVQGEKGASVHVRELIAAFGRLGHSVVLAAPKLNKSPWEQPETLSSPLLHIPLNPENDAVVIRLKNFLEQTLGTPTSLPGELRRILYNLEAEEKLSRQFSETPPDFIYERAALYSTLGLSLSKKFNVPVVVELNSPLALEQSTYRGNGFGPLAGQIEETMLSQVDAVLTVSESLREHVMAAGIVPEKIKVFPNGVNPLVFHPGESDSKIRARLDVGKGPVLGFVGGLRPWHGVETFPLLLEQLVPRYPDLRLVIVGDGPLRATLDRELEQRSLTRHVVFPGWVGHEDVSDFIRLFDIGLAPYVPLNHTFYFSPLKLFECMACGVPMVVPRLGQIEEVVRHGETGLLYSAGDLDGLVTACDQLLQDVPLRRRMGQAAAKHIHDQHTWDHNATRVAELARSLLAGRRHAQES